MTDRAAQAVSELVTEGLSETRAQELVSMAFTAGQAAEGAEQVTVRREGPWTWRVRDSMGYDATADTLPATLTIIADRLTGREGSEVTVTLVA